MATKQEIAESLTVNELRDFADAEGIDLTGAVVKPDIVDRVVAGSTLAALQAYAQGDEPVADASSTTATTTEAPSGATGASVGAEGEVMVKAWPEVPTQAQIDAATTTEPVEAPKVTIGDGDEIELRPDDAAQIRSRYGTLADVHEGNAQQGYWSNPDITLDWSDEEDVKKNNEEYEARIVEAPDSAPSTA